MAWTPGQRKAARALEDPFVDVPDHLTQPLWNWIAGSLALRGGRGLVDADRMEKLAVDLRTHFAGDTGPQKLRSLMAWCSDQPTRMLDVVEQLLERHGWDNGSGEDLADLLTRANSAYVVNPDWDGLQERLAPGVKEVVQEAVNAASGSAGEHLATAWNEAYGRNPDPTKAYSEAVKAVESAMASRVAPQNSVQTLGTMIRDIAAKPSKWKFAIAGKNADGVETVLSMMRMLWDGQTSRHGGANPTRVETADEARAAVHLAASLVQFGVSGAFDLV